MKKIILILLAVVLFSACNKNVCPSFELTTSIEETTKSIHAEKSDFLKEMQELG